MLVHAGDACGHVTDSYVATHHHHCHLPVWLRGYYRPATTTIASLCQRRINLAGLPTYVLIECVLSARIIQHPLVSAPDLQPPHQPMNLTPRACPICGTPSPPPLPQNRPYYHPRSNPRYSPLYAKALLRKGQALLGLCCFREAAAAFEQGLAAEPQHPQLRQALEAATAALLQDVVSGWCVHNAAALMHCATQYKVHSKQYGGTWR